MTTETSLADLYSDVILWIRGTRTLSCEETTRKYHVHVYIENDSSPKHMKTIMLGTHDLRRPAYINMRLIGTQPSFSNCRKSMKYEISIPRVA